MSTRRFGYYRPKSLEQAVEYLKEHGDKAKVLAGGQSLIPLMKLRLASPEVLVDIGRIAGLSGIKEDGETLHIGALARHRDLEQSSITRDRYPILAEAARSLGDPQVRNMGTIGGAVAHADPASDWGAALMAADARVVATGADGIRTIPIDDFFRDTFSTALEPTEVLTEIQVPRPATHSGGAYMKLKRKTGDYATAAAAVKLELDPQGAVTKARIALAAAGPTPMRASRAEEFLRGRMPEEENLRRAASLAAEEANPSSDLRGSEEYKRAMIEVYTRRALEAAVARARR